MPSPRASWILVGARCPRSVSRRTSISGSTDDSQYHETSQPGAASNPSRRVSRGNWLAPTISQLVTSNAAAVQSRAWLSAEGGNSRYPMFMKVLIVTAPDGTESQIHAGKRGVHRLEVDEAEDGSVVVKFIVDRPMQYGDDHVTANAGSEVWFTEVFPAGTRWTGH